MEKFSKELLRIEHFVLRIIRFYLLALFVFSLGYYRVLLVFILLKGIRLSNRC